MESNRDRHAVQLPGGLHLQSAFHGPCACYGQTDPASVPAQGQGADQGQMVLFPGQPARSHDWNQLDRLSKERRTTILISSHILSELYLVSSRFGFISHGRLIKEVNKDELLIDVDQSSRAAMILDRRGIGPFQVLDDHQILIRQENLEPGPINRLLVQEGILVNQISQQKGSLEEYSRIC